MNKVQLSGIQEGGVFRSTKTGSRRMKFLVLKRVPEDLRPGWCRTVSEDGEVHTWNWHLDDPLVEYLGQGKLIIGVERLRRKR